MEDDSKLDPSSPFYLGSGYQRGNLITHVVLRGDNYLSWSRAMTLALKARRKFGFVDGTITKPSDKKQLLDWETVNFMLVSWMLRSMEPKLASILPYHDNAQQLWNTQAKKFRIPNGARLQQLRAAIIDCKQEKGMSVEDYHAKLLGLYDDLLQLKPLRVCECGLCTCDVGSKVDADRAEETFHQYLIGGDDDLYGSVRTNLLSRDPLPSLDDAHLTFIQEEQSRGIARAEAAKDYIQTQNIFAIHTPRSLPRVDKHDKSKLVCTHCTLKGHDITTCFKIYGIPVWYEDIHARRAKGSNSDRSSAIVHPSRPRVPPVKANFPLGCATNFRFCNCSQSWRFLLD